MNDITVTFPLIILLAGSGLAALFGLPALNRRLTITQFSWLLALFPAAAFALFLSWMPALSAGEIFTWQRVWIPSLSLSLGFYVDGWSLLFALIVTFIGILVVVYAGQYFKGDQSAWRFLAYLMVFMVSMVGIVTAGDVLSLFVFWEGTSIFSFLLIAYKYKYEEARIGAFRSLFITGGGGIAMLGGLLFVSYVAGGTDFATILSSGDVLRSHEFYLVMLGLVAFGAFTKSAQWPAHIWLPGAMSAPTPASAYLHSATMVKAGIYLMARMNPALGFTDAWFWLLTAFGGFTMLVGAYIGLKQNDLKALLAYSTISQLGVLMMLIGQDVPEAYKALVIGIVAHALYKSALFLVAGIVDHEAGTRDIRRLGGLRKAMPYTFAVGTLAALSMAGLPPMFGFLAKETLLVTITNMPPVIAELIRWSAVAAGALMLAQAGVLIWETFMGQPKDEKVHAHEAPWLMWMAPAVPAVLSLVFSILPEPKEEATFLGAAAKSAFGGSVKVSTVLFHGLTVEFFLSLAAITLGFVLFFFRHRVRAWQAAILPRISFNSVYNWALALIDKGGYYATRLQQGKLRLYLVIMLVSIVGLVLLFGRASLWPGLDGLTTPTLDFLGELVILRLFALLTVVAAALATVVLPRDIQAIFALGASGLGVAVLFVLEPAPDVALVQIVVDILAMVILVLALTRLPRRQRRLAQELRTERALDVPGVVRDAVVALGVGVIVTAVTLTALLDRPRPSLVTPYYQANAKELTGATDVVGAIIVDYRALDTLIEITVFSMAGLGIYVLLRYAARKFGDTGQQIDELPAPDTSWFKTMGIGGLVVSPFIRVSAYVVLPLALVLGATHVIYGHDQPGDGFTAGVIISLAVGLWYVVYGYEETRRRLPWLQPSRLVSLGILLAIFTGSLAFMINGSFLSPVNFGEMLGLPLPRGFYFSSSFLFELSICLTVLGSVAYMLGTLGHPGYLDQASAGRLREISEEEKKEIEAAPTQGW